MYSIRRSNPAIIACYASASTLDTLLSLPDVLPCRVAPDELLLISEDADGERMLRAVTTQLASVEPTAIAMDQSDGWAVRTLYGEGAAHVLAKLFATRLPEARPAFVQGLVAGVPAKILVRPGLVQLLVPYPSRDYVDGRLLDVGGVAVAADIESTTPTLDAFASSGRPGAGPATDRAAST